MNSFKTSIAILAGIIVGATASIALAWTGPTGTAPANNVSAPVNVGSTAQTKNGSLGVNALAVFGDTLLSGLSAGTGRYLNFDYTVGGTSGVGSAGYGIRDNAGTMEFKNNGGAWSSLSNTINSLIATYLTNGSVTSIKFSDGTTQTTAANTSNTYTTLIPQSSAPLTCNSTNKGAMSLTSYYRLCACNSSAWVSPFDGSTCNWSGMVITSATYGGNCGAATGNATANVAAHCNSLSSCNYTVSTAVLGDPTVGCAKTFTVNYSCASAKSASLGAEADGHTVTLTCP